MILDARQEVTGYDGWLVNGQPVQDSPQAIIGIAVHHDADVTPLPSTATEQEERAMIRQIDAQHVSQDFGGIGYHRYGFSSGRVYRTGNLAGRKAGVLGRNHELRHIVVNGDFSTAQPSSLLLDALTEGLQDMLQGLLPGVEIHGHSWWALPGHGTACPGTIAGLDFKKMVAGIRESFYTREEMLHALACLSGFSALEKFNSHDSPKERMSGFSKAIIRDIVARMD